MADKQFDSIIFDMDGTLWDAVDSYCEIWNRTIEACGTGRGPVDRGELIDQMGHPLVEIMDIILPAQTPEERHEFITTLERFDSLLMPRLGGRLYPGVEDTLAALKSQGLKLFLVSNCGPEGLPMFLQYTGLSEFFTDHLSYGQTGCEKDVNIRTLIERYNLKAPLYVGDTAGDLRSTRRAGIPFAWASWGFGIDFIPSEADIVLKDFPQLLAL